VDFDILAYGFRRFCEFRGFRGFRFLGRPHIACNFNCLIESGVLLKVRGQRQSRTLYMFHVVILMVQDTRLSYYKLLIGSDI